jgi:hypothetical protein
LRFHYHKVFGRDLDKDIEKEEGGALGRIFRSLAQGVRPASNGIDQELAKREAQELYDVCLMIFYLFIYKIFIFF